jgi:hypothetical protein
MTTPAGYVDIAEYQHPLTVIVNRPICPRCAMLIAQAGKPEIIKAGVPCKI